MHEDPTPLVWTARPNSATWFLVPRPGTVVQKIGSQRILGQLYEQYDVHCERSRWWVISNPMTLYSQEDFPEVDVAFSFHLGLTMRVLARSRTDLDDNGESQVSGASCRYRQAVEAMDSATEAAHFQAMGIMCRDALLALVHEHVDDAWVGEVAAPPKRSDLKGLALDKALPLFLPAALDQGYARC